MHTRVLGVFPGAPKGTAGQGRGAGMRCPESARHGRDVVGPWLPVPLHSCTQHGVLPGTPPPHPGPWDLREGKGHQGPADHDEVQDVPEVTEVGTLVQDEPQVDHLWAQQ